MRYTGAQKRLQDATLVTNHKKLVRTYNTGVDAILQKVCSSEVRGLRCSLQAQQTRLLVKQTGATAVVMIGQ